MLVELSMSVPCHLPCKTIFSLVFPHNAIVVQYWDKVGYNHKRDQIEVMVALVVIVQQRDLVENS